MVEQYYAGVDWSSQRDIYKVLRAYEQILAQLQSDTNEYKKLTNLLRRDGFKYEGSYLIAVGHIGMAKIEDASDLVDRSTLREHLRRIEQSVESDPAQAVGSAKELVETVGKLVLTYYDQWPGRYDSVQQLIKQAMKCLNLSAEQLPETVKGADAMKQVLTGLAQVVGGIAELRNLYGTGHGRVQTSKLEPRHASLVVGAASTLCVFLLETLDARKRAGE